MTSPVFALDSRQTQLDSLLEQVCLGLELTQSQYEDAERKYQAVGAWLAEEGSPLRAYSPEIYPQGSMLLGTTNRPWRGEEFDIDLVCELHGCSHMQPLDVYQSVQSRLASHKTYFEMLEPKNRCLRLNYAGDFHLDALPSCPDALRKGTCIKVPDRKLKQWTPSNPRGFGEWFFTQCRISTESYEGAIKAGIAPLPGPRPSQGKFALQRIVQLIKRHRDSFFDGDASAAKSIVLTTLAAQSYYGEQSLFAGLSLAVNSMLVKVESYPGILPIPNPTNPQENFSDSWTTQSYEEFKRYLRNFRALLSQLADGSGLSDLNDVFGKLFGAEIARTAFCSYGKLAQELRERNQVRLAVGTAGLTTGLSGIPIPRNTFFGDR